ncbi:MAG TPA: peptide MFS transporter [Gemmatimonadales bacterium]|nr:peptide MFS transporter [Gemmatimonadales bacterium]
MASVTSPTATPAQPGAANPSAGTAAASDRAFFGHPRGLSTLFFTEMWERFSFYGMRALLILFMTAAVATGGLGFDAAKAGVIYGTYTSLAYLTSVPGGWLADRFLGQRRATLWGGVIIMSGHICLAIPTMTTFYLGLLLIVSGTGLLKPNVSTMVGQLYTQEDVRRDAGFSIFYMGINLGAFLSPLVCGWLAQSEQFRGILNSVGISPESSWHWGFGAAAVGMGLGVLQYLAGWKYLGDAGMYPAPARDEAERRGHRRRLQLGIASILGVCAAVAVLAVSGVVRVTPEGVATAFGMFLLAVTVALFIWLLGAKDWTPDERKRVITIAVLFLASTVFWMVFEQAGSTLNLFAERSTENRILGMSFPASWLQSVNAIFLIIFAPIFAWVWLRLGRRDPSSPTKFVFGLIFAAAGFALLIVPARLAEAGVRVSPLWLVGTYLMHTFGELCLSPVGLSATTKLAPARVAGFMMGIWFLSLSLGNYLGGRVASLYEAVSLPTLFGAVTAAGLGAALLLALVVRPINRMLASSR